MEMAIDEYDVSNVVKGHHVHKDIWTSFVNEELIVACESGNIHDPHVSQCKTSVSHVQSIYKL
jgi:hypothetical protein